MPQRSPKPTGSAEHPSLAAALARKAIEAAPGTGAVRVIGAGDGFEVFDILCTRGPRDRPFGERHTCASVSLVTAGVFSFRNSRRSHLMSPGAVLLINSGESFECSHQHSEGDRCLSFQFTPQLLDEIRRDLNLRRSHFAAPRLEPTRALAPLLARACATRDSIDGLEDVALELAAEALTGAPAPTSHAPTPQDERRVAHALRRMHSQLSERHNLMHLAQSVDVSRYHFLRMFKRVTGLTPHHWLLRARLLEAARLLRERTRSVTEIALEVGFEDLSNFSRTFHAEFHASPRSYGTR